MKRFIPNILASDLTASRNFYTSLLGLEVKFESDWYIQLGSAAHELGLHRRDHDLIPPDFQASPSGMYLTFVVENADEVHSRAVQMGIHVVQTPEDTPYGLRRMLLADPDGLLLDVSSMIPSFQG